LKPIFVDMGAHRDARYIEVYRQGSRGDYGDTLPFAELGAPWSMVAFGMFQPAAVAVDPVGAFLLDSTIGQDAVLPRRPHNGTDLGCSVQR
jgi:hypothetical protein